MTLSRRLRTIQTGLCLLYLLCAAADARAAESPEAAVKAFLLAMQSDGVPTAVSNFTHPEEAARLKRMLMPRIRRCFDDPSDNFCMEVFGEELTLAEFEAMRSDDFLGRLLWRSQMSGTEVQPPIFIESTRKGDVVNLVVLTRFTGLDGVKTEKRDVVSLKAMGNSWKLMLSSELEAYATILLSR